MTNSDANETVATRILSKEKISDLIQCLNPLSVDLLGSIILEEDKKKSDLEQKQLNFPKLCAGKDLKHEQSSHILQVDQKLVKPKLLGNLKRSQSIQQQINNAQHVPIIEFAFTNSKRYGDEN
jgi:hypothetical protein